MHTKTLEFAISNPNSHIAVVDAERYETIAHFNVALHQLSMFIGRVSHAERKLYLTNGTMIYFFPITSGEKLRGLQLDRIETTPAVLSLCDAFFLEICLKPDIAPDEGIIYRDKGEYGGNEPIPGFANG